MRDDMARVIVERPRIPAFNSRKGRCKDWDELPAHEGLRRAQSLRGDRKTLNENLKPLRRYLERQVGRPWGKVYAEIAAHLRVDNAVQQHVRDHLRDFVAVQPRRINHGWHSFGGRTLWWQPLYVDPVTGLLCRTDQLPEEKTRRRAAQRTPAPQLERIPLADDRELRRLRGFWYEVRLSPLPDPEYRAYREVQNRPLKPHRRGSRVIEVEVTVRRLATPAVRDVAIGELINAGPAIDDRTAWQEYRRRHPDRRYAIAKRMLSCQELRRRGLSNLSADDA
ncbi:MAG TPA: hypothetical protein VHX12_13845 [Acidisoma sp.]|jgi:hypothetical protein|nr:hypothetical protein [Acidisoma sp.]